VIGLAITILNMLAVRFLILVFIILFLIDYAKNKNEQHLIPRQVAPDGDIVNDEEVVVEIHPLLQSMLNGKQTMPDSAFEWRDINIFSGIGDKIIDLSQSITTDDTAIVSI